MTYPTVLMIVAMVATAAVPVIAVLRAPLWQEFHLGEPEPLRTSMTATVVRPIQSPRGLHGGQAALGTGPRVIRGKVVRQPPAIDDD